MVRNLARWAVMALTAAAWGCASVATTARPAMPVQPATSMEQAIDALLEAEYPAGGPGAVAIVVTDGRVAYRRAFGLANVELQVPMRPEHVFGIASLSKQFTAAAILKLADRGALSVEDDITRYLPMYPTHGAHITIEHLLTHTSGISALSETSDLRAASVQDGRLVDVLSEWVRDLPPDSAPGERWSYLNFGYSLLAAIVERVSGVTFPQFLQREIFEPLGMTQTYDNDRRRIIPLRAAGYDAPRTGVSNVLSPRSRVYQPNGAGSLLSTVDDLARWSDALSSGRVLTAASMARMFTPYRLTDGTSSRYGYGFDIGEYEGQRVQAHLGSTTGFVSFMIRMPDAGVFVAILSNKASAAVPIQATAQRVAAIAVGKPIPEPRPVPMADEALDALAGTYRGDDVGLCVVRRDGRRLLADVAGFEKLELIPVAPLTFRSRVVTWTFAFTVDGGGKGAQVHVTDWKIDDRAPRVEPRSPAPVIVVPVAPALLDACVGEYELLSGIIVAVTRAGDHLAIRPAAQALVEILPVSADEFVNAEGSVRYRFVRNARGEVTGYLRLAGGAAVPARRLSFSLDVAGTRR